MDSYVDVALPLPFDQTFTYRIPSASAGKIQPGTRLRVPFGHRSLVGVAVSLADRSDRAGIKDVAEVLDAEPFLTGDLWKTVRWMAGYYACSLGEAAAACLPPILGGKARRPGVVVLARDPGGVDWDRLARRAPRQAELVRLLRDRGGRVRHDELAGLGLGGHLVRALVGKGWARVEGEVAPVPAPPARPELTPDQESALGAILASLAGGGYRAFLLYGVTASGKTEIYLRAMEETLARGKTVIFLVPEIGLAPQTGRRIEERFGGRMGVLHSRLTGPERYEIWKRARSGAIQIVVGARSAVFAPLPDLGLLVVDEEHETSYKQSEKPRYHARNVALVRARHAGATVVLGSATPSLESLENVRQGKLIRLDLPRRVGGGRLPAIRLVDLTRESWEESATFSAALIDALRARQDRGEQSILLLNRRGHSNFLQCQECGWVVRCPHCDISLTFHRVGGVLLCHYCGARRAPPGRCAECGGARVSHRGYGTQRVEQELAALLPGAVVERMDVDTTRGKRSHHEILARFARGEADILLGTQMVAKGHHFPRVSLVGVLGADQGLNFPDFRAGERTLQLLMQVAGRAGRGIPGEVLLQTYAPGHPVFGALLAHGYDAFMEGELEMRRSLGYPPATRLAVLTVQGPREEAVVEAAETIAREARRYLGKRGRVMGPVAAILSRIRDRYRWQILIKGNLSAAAKRNLGRIAQEGLRSVRGGSRLDCALDVDPESIL